MANIPAVKRNIAKMLQQSASETEIDAYLNSVGVTHQELRDYRPIDVKRIGLQMMGGAAGGLVGAGAGPVGSAVGIGLGSGMAGQAYDLAQEAAGAKPRDTLAERMRIAGEDVMLDVISPFAMSKGVYGIKKLASKLGQKSRGIYKPAEYWVYKRFGVEPTAAMVTRSKGLAGAEEGLSKFPVTSDIMQRAGEERMQQLTLANRYLASEYGQILEREEVGTLLKKAVPGVLDKYENIYGKLFSRVADDVQANLPNGLAQINNTVETLRELIQRSQAGPDSNITRFAKRIEEKAQASGGGLPWKALKDHRTRIGYMLKDPVMRSQANLDQGELKALYGALTQDMEQAALQAGEKTHAKWRAANKYFETKMARDVPILEDVMKKKYPEEVLDAVLRSSQKGGTRLRLLKNQLSKKEWDAVVGTSLYEMGLETPGAGATVERVFSPRTFLSNYRKMSHSAKRVLFQGTEYNGLPKELDNFLHVVSDMTAAQKMANVSNTGPIIGFYSLLYGTGALTGGMLQGPEGIAKGVAFATGAVAVPRLTAKLLTSPKFVRWLATGANIAKTHPNDLSSHLGRLMVFRFREDIQEDVDQVIKSIIGE